MDADPRYRDDCDLAARILAGSDAHWHEFLQRYSALILSVLKRYLFDEDEVKDLWADVLARLRRGRLAGYEGRSKLSTWLVFVVRSAAIDHLRHRHGRLVRPDAWEELSPRQRFVYDALFRQRRSTADVAHTLRERGELDDGASVAEIVAELEEHLGDGALGRLAWDVHADSVGAVSGRLLAYLDHAQREADERQQALGPERGLLQRHARETLARVQVVLDELPADERRVLELRFKEGRTAPRIAAEMDVPQRRVYTLIDRAVRRLRRMLGDGASVLVVLFLR